jgi:4-carboxymuconolactone decarboxylase
MGDYKEHLRRLALHDNALVGSLTSESTESALNEKTAALVRIAATISLDGATASLQHAVELALAAGATQDEIVATLEAVTPVAGTSRVVAAAPKLALALGYDVDEALE